MPPSRFERQVPKYAIAFRGVLSALEWLLEQIILGINFFRNAIKFFFYYEENKKANSVCDLQIICTKRIKHFT